MEYPKINSLWKREERTSVNGKRTKAKHNLIPGHYALEEFGLINKWLVQEKIDGTNIRIHYHLVDDNRVIDFHGRTDNASIPPQLLKYLRNHFTVERMSRVFNPDAVKCFTQIILFGEGYGPKIQSGGNYCSEAGFILFDIKMGEWWLKQEVVQRLAKSLEIPYAPIIGIMTEQEIVEYVKSKPLSMCSQTPQVMEGVVVRTNPELYLRNGDRLIWKLKCKDFDTL